MKIELRTWKISLKSWVLADQLQNKQVYAAGSGVGFLFLRGGVWVPEGPAQLFVELLPSVTSLNQAQILCVCLCDLCQLPVRQ